MFPTSVKNLYIGKSDINFQVQGSINGMRIKDSASLDPTTLIGELFIPTDPTNPHGPFSPDYYLPNGYWDGENFLINPIGTELYTIWVTGVPLDMSERDFLLEDSIYKGEFRDSHHSYLFQVTKQQII